MPTGLGDEKLWLCPTLDNATPFNDLSSQGNNGTAAGGLSTVADTGSGGSFAYDLNGTTQYITLGNVLTGTGDFTISGWFNTDSTSYSYIYGKDVAGPGSDGIGIAQESNAVYGAIGDSSGRTVLATAGTTAISTWYHYAVTFDRDGVATKYLNGVQVGTDSISSRSGDIGTDTDYVGRFGSSSGGFFDGKLDDIRAYNRALTQSEIYWLATERGVQGTPPAGLGDEQLWLCPSIQSGANDLSGNGLDGVMGSSVTIVADTSNGGTLAYNFPDTDVPNNIYNQITVNGLDLGNLSQLTWSAWIYDESDNATSTHSSFFSWRRTGGNGNEDILFLNYERSTLFFQLNNGSDGGAGYTPVYYQNWKHYCVVFDGTNPTATDRLNLYVNGVLQTPGTTFSYPATTANPSGTPFAEIGDYANSGNYSIFNFKGKQDDIRTYERALTQAEITHLASQRGVQGSPTTTTQYNAFSTHAFRQLFQTRLR